MRNLINYLIYKVSILFFKFIFWVEEISDFFDKKEELEKQSNKDHFAHRLHISDREVIANKNLSTLRDDMLRDHPDNYIGKYFEKLSALTSSKLYTLLNHMPKPAVHHVHTTAAVPISYLVKTITYFDFVYYSMKEAKY